MSEANECTVRFERHEGGWFVECPFECGWGEKCKEDETVVLLKSLIDHLDAKHKIGNA